MLIEARLKKAVITQGAREGKRVESIHGRIACLYTFIITPHTRPFVRRYKTAAGKPIADQVLSHQLQRSLAPVERKSAKTQPSQE